MSETAPAAEAATETTAPTAAPALTQITHADPEFGNVGVVIHDTLIRQDLVIAADVPSGRVWCWQIDGNGNKLKTVELKTGTVKILGLNNGQEEGKGADAQ